MVLQWQKNAKGEFHSPHSLLSPSHEMPLIPTALHKHFKSSLTSSSLSLLSSSLPGSTKVTQSTCRGLF